jgi:hypothetical protein
MGGIGLLAVPEEEAASCSIHLGGAPRLGADRFGGWFFAVNRALSIVRLEGSSLAGGSSTQHLLML